MNKTSKYALLLASALAVATSAQAYSNGDLLVGFTGGAQDFIYDLGQASSLTPGETWTIGADLGTQFGVVGALNSGSHIYATSSDSAENGYNYSSAFFNQDRANISTIAGSLLAGQSRTTTRSDTTGWTMQTAQAPGTPGNYLFNNLFDPNVSVGPSGSSTTAYLFDNVTGTATPDSYFSYDSASGHLAFGVAAVPEPSTFSLLGSFGLLALAARRQLLKA